MRERREKNVEVLFDERPQSTRFCSFCFVIFFSSLFLYGFRFCVRSFLARIRAISVEQNDFNE